MQVCVIINLVFNNFYILYVYAHALRCLKELLDCDAVITKADKEGDNALHIACIHGQLNIVQFLLQQGQSAELRCVAICVE